MSQLRTLVVSYKWLSLFAGMIILLGMGAPATAWSQQMSEQAVAPNPVGTVFTYQGRLSTNSGPATGAYDFQFTLYDAETDGNVIGATQTQSNINVNAGVFAVQLDFGAGAFPGAPRWLRIAVRPAGNGEFEALAPRQPLTPVPYAIFAENINFGSDGTATTAARSDHTHLGQEWAGSSETGMKIVTDSTSGISFNGQATATSGTTAGIFGSSASGSGRGVQGEALANTGTNAGVAGFTESAGGYGIYGQNNAQTGVAVGVRGISRSTTGYGIQGNAIATSGENYGVAGYTTSPDGYGVYGYNQATSGFARGVYGQIDSNDGRAVEGYVSASSGRSAGITGITQSAEGIAVYAHQKATTSGTGSKLATGVLAIANPVGGRAVEGFASAQTGESDGILGFTNSPNGVGIYGHNFANGGKAALFDGDVAVNGRLTKSSGSFKIDHPLDPENKYLYHSFVESPDMMNIYNGNATLDGNGEAWVQLPDWFEALNMEFRYQLTPIGASAPNLYVAQEIVNNRFKVAGGAANQKISWQVTGIRNDPYAQANRIPVEEEKPREEQGTYLHPQEYGQPETRGLIYRSGRVRYPGQPLAEIPGDGEDRQQQPDEAELLTTLR